MVAADAECHARRAVQQLPAAVPAGLHVGRPEAHVDIEAEEQRLAAS